MKLCDILLRHLTPNEVVLQIDDPEGIVRCGEGSHGEGKLHDRPGDRGADAGRLQIGLGTSQSGTGLLEG